MPFLDDTGPRDEQRRPFWAAFATIGGQLERLVATNIAWALVLLPAGLAFAAPSLPDWLRILLAVTSATAIPPATAILFGLAAQACDGQHVDAGLAAELLRRYGAASLRTLGPLYGTFGILVWLVIATTEAGLAPLVTVVVLVLLLWTVCAMYWGPAFVADPDRPFSALARESLQRAWREPERSFGTLLLVGLAALVGIASVAGIVLIVPVFVAILQTHQYRDVQPRFSRAASRS
jgi:hypothetical protein